MHEQNIGFAPELSGIENTFKNTSTKSYKKSLKNH